MQGIREAVAFLFRRAAEQELTEDEIARQASLDLHWLTPKDARRFVRAAEDAGFLRRGGRPGTLAPTFDPGSVELPLDFRLGPEALEGAPAGGPSSGGVLGELVAAAAAALGERREDVEARVAQKAADKLLDPPVAAALVAAAAGVDLAPYLDRLREELRRPRGPTLSASG